MRQPKDIKVLVACEESQAVTIEFRKLGFDAYSCDLLPCSGGHPDWHIMGDAIEALYSRKWDLVIAHPPCTRLSNSGVRWLKERNLWSDLSEACSFFNTFRNYGELGAKIIIENPIPHKYAVLGFWQHDEDMERHVQGIGEYHQLIQPYHFGHLEKKATCLWIYNMPLLKHANNVYEEMMCLPYKERAKIHYASPGKERAKLRSKTYKGIAEAMASQYGKYIISQPD